MTGLVFRGGTVCDPGTGLFEVADVLVSGGRVGAVGADLVVPEDSVVVDVSGLVVGPGFVDVHSHVDSVAGHRLQAMDGVCTALELEAGAMRVERAYSAAAASGRPLHYGYSASWGSARFLAHTGVEPSGTLALVGESRWQRSSTGAERRRWLSLLEDELAVGGLGIGVLQGYAPRTDPGEFLDVARLAARAGVPVFTHVRELVEADPTTPIDGSGEVVRAAVEAGAAMHHCHVNSTSRRYVDRVLGALDEARRDGLQVTVEAYPYGFGSTAIGAFFLAPERLAVSGLAPSDLVVVDTGERIADVSRLREIRVQDPATQCLVHFLDERDEADNARLLRALAFPDSIVASDAMWLTWPDGSHESDEWPLPPGARTHPRTAGTFAKAWRLMVREQKRWSWLEAFRRCSYLPARVLDGICAAARRKGHLGVGADADIVVLDPATITDRATVTDPTRPSSGIRHLLVAGTPVVTDGQLDPGVLPGQPIRAG
ncbi:amidohydrolase family protein [Amycolatopsis jejuensis]|uniref:amidohydrolase family protein n=1 Tax=Amycolatopsis jejuensis TaxID=330084 RepID=UPI003CCB7D4B